MSTLLLEPTEGAVGAGRTEAGVPYAPVAGPRRGPTLDELIAGVWEGLLANETVGCPACGGAMVPRYAAGAGAVGGACRDCGAELS